MRLGGWLRLWVVLGMLWGIAVTFLAYDSRPRIENVRSAWVSEGWTAIATRISELEGVTVHPWQVSKHKLGEDASAEAAIAYFETIERDPKRLQYVFAGRLADINEHHRARIAEIKKGWPQYVMWSAAAWLGPLLVLLGAGLAARWVWRGFKFVPRPEIERSVGTSK